MNFWMSFDCDASDSNNYRELYTWLEEHNALECGDSVAFIKGYSYNEDFIKEITESLNSIPHINKIYICSKDDGDGKFYGRFIKGSRGINKWKGYKKS